ncbi:MAG: Threonine-phosphate decarboxylase [Firmicutes bacterium ADurb.Bin193]|nr:MAG: Threonine-phosphate decarboxylase [Firmicutes bacterium ADurb.Bin193]
MLVSRSYKSLAGVSDKQYERAKEVVATACGVSKGNIILAGGTAELLYNAVRTLRPRKALIPVPAIKLYEEACRKNGCEPLLFQTDRSNNFDIDADRLIQSAADVDMIILGNPQNPTGRIIEKPAMNRILDFCQEKGIYLVIDESYADFVAADISAVGQVDRYANVIILRSVANYFALSGIGSGYAVSCEGLIGLLEMNGIPDTVSWFSAEAYEVLLRDAGYIKKTKQWLKSEPKRFFNMVSTLGGVFACRPYANYIFAELEQIPCATFCECLEQKGAAVYNCNGISGSNGRYIRLAIKDKKTNDKFLDIFSRCLL